MFQNHRPDDDCIIISYAAYITLMHWQGQWCKDTMKLHIFKEEKANLFDWPEDLRHSLVQCLRALGFKLPVVVRWHSREPRLFQCCHSSRGWQRGYSLSHGSAHAGFHADTHTRQSACEESFSFMLKVNIYQTPMKFSQWSFKTPVEVLCETAGALPK